MQESLGLLCVQGITFFANSSTLVPFSALEVLAHLHARVLAL